MFWAFKLSFVVDFWPFLTRQLFGQFLKNLAHFFNLLVTLAGNTWFLFLGLS
jgi:hypothetical protein